MMENDLLIFWTDGAYSGSKDKGGWSFYCPSYQLKVCSSEEHTTNNRMELMAAIKALEWISDSNIPDRKILIYSDSMYLVETMNGRYQKKKNTDLWEQLDTLLELLFDKTIIWKYTKGHAKNDSLETKGNNVVDSLAVMAYNLI